MTTNFKLWATRCALVAALGGICCGSAHAADEVCTFHTSDAHYASLTSPGELLTFTWRKGTRKVSSIQWVTGGVEWYPFASQPGTVVPESFPGDYHLRVNLGMTTAGFETSRYEVRGYLNANFPEGSATFAGVYEGSSSAWFVAYGQLTCEAG